MSAPDSRWGSERSRQVIVTVVMAGILLVSLAMAFAFVQTRSKAKPLGMSERAAMPEPGVKARKMHRS